MKKETGLGRIGTIIHMIFIIIAIVAIVFAAQKILTEEKKADIKANMLLIQGACKVREKTATKDKDDTRLIGTKLSEIQNDKIINEFEKLDVLSKDDYDNYYVLNNENLEELAVDVKNEKDAYYLINYSNSEVITTKEYNGKYKLSEIAEE